ncbi:hypothetical protein ACFYSW_28665 [Rhodococcus aetherivorans]|uniref:hypothetical protein n=1 Tax=Rhodococcus aetherivorans TaxID=191292 RepID=UPI0036C1AC32
MTEEESSNGDHFDNVVIGNMLEIFVAPELRRRGANVDPREIDRFLVELEPDGNVTVRLGEEARLKGDLFKVQDGDGYYLENVAPQEGEVGPNSGWVAYLRAENGAGTLGFDFRRNLKRARGLIDKSEDYWRGAVTLGREKNISPAIDLLYSAAELSVQAMMALQSDHDPNHELRRKWLRRWAEARNSPASHSQVLDNLAQVRPTARYEAEDPKLKKGRFDQITAAVREMIDTARTYTGERSPGVKHAVAEQFARHETWTGEETEPPC